MTTKKIQDYATLEATNSFFKKYSTKGKEYMQDFVNCEKITDYYEKTALEEILPTSIIGLTNPRNMSYENGEYVISEKKEKEIWNCNKEMTNSIRGIDGMKAGEKSICLAEMSVARNYCQWELNEIEKQIKKEIIKIKNVTISNALYDAYSESFKYCKSALKPRNDDEERFPYVILDGHSRHAALLLSYIAVEGYEKSARGGKLLPFGIKDEKDFNTAVSFDGPSRDTYNHDLFVQKNKVGKESMKYSIVTEKKVKELSNKYFFGYGTLSVLGLIFNSNSTGDTKWTTGQINRFLCNFSRVVEAALIVYAVNNSKKSIRINDNSWETLAFEMMTYILGELPLRNRWDDIRYCRAISINFLNANMDSIKNKPSKALYALPTYQKVLELTKETHNPVYIQEYVSCIVKQSSNGFLNPKNKNNVLKLFPGQPRFFIKDFLSKITLKEEPSSKNFKRWLNDYRNEVITSLESGNVNSRSMELRNRLKGKNIPEKYWDDIEDVFMNFVEA